MRAGVADTQNTGIFFFEYLNARSQMLFSFFSVRVWSEFLLFSFGTTSLFCDEDEEFAQGPRNLCLLGTSDWAMCL